MFCNPLWVIMRIDSNEVDDYSTTLSVAKSTAAVPTTTLAKVNAKSKKKANQKKKK